MSVNPSLEVTRRYVSITFRRFRITKSPTQCLFMNPFRPRGFHTHRIDITVEKDCSPSINITAMS